MTSKEIREKFLSFFEKNGHKIMPSSSLLPSDPSVLFTTAGMQQFKSYYLNPELALAKNIVSVQKCIRTSDIDEVGDETHLTFFEMLGNFSFGAPVLSRAEGEAEGYWKKEAIKLAYEFLTKELKLKIDYVTIFSPEKVDKTDWRKNVPEDKESYEIWKSLGVKNIKREGVDNFWGPTGADGPCGPTTEIYIEGVEIWNLVFNEYYCSQDKKLEKLKIQGIDTGMGFERLIKVIQKKQNIFETDLFLDIFAKLPENLNQKEMRVIADHLRASVFLLADGILPSNKEQGYILRRLLRRAMTIGYISEINKSIFQDILRGIIENYGQHYEELQQNKDNIISGFLVEDEKFQKTLRQGLKEINRLDKITADEAFKLYESFGLPYEVIKDVAGLKADSLTREQFEMKFKEHQQKSRKGQEKKFGGHGLILNTGELKATNQEELEKVTRLHTATHLLQASLRKVLGDNIRQAGSDITAERLRFDFTFDRKLTNEEIKKTEDLINEIIQKDLTVIYKEMPMEKAKESGALFFFREKYPEVVKVYSIEDSNGNVFSKELCGGPHVKSTSEIGTIKIVKEEALGAGIRRIRVSLV